MIVKCEECEAIVDAEELTNYVHVDNDAGMAGRYTFLRCPKCSSPFVTLQTDDGSGWDSPYRLYPPNEMGVSLAIPNPIRVAYEEAQSCFRAKAFTATAIMCRKALEGICEEHKIVARDLASALKAMRDKGVIENRLYDWADALRISGNEAAHDVNITISAQDAKDILEFTNALLEYVFTFQDRFEEFKRRRNKTKTDQSTI